MKNHLNGLHHILNVIYKNKQMIKKEMRGRPKGETEKKRVNVNLDKDIADKTEGVGRSQLVNRLLRNYLNAKKK